MCVVSVSLIQDLVISYPFGVCRCKTDKLMFKVETGLSIIVA